MSQAYRKKRDFTVTPEPSGRDSASHRKPAGIYVIQKHRASHLHYDFRLQFGGTLLSWAVPKGPSLDPAVKRLAMRVEDHHVEYANFEGVIPEGEYGGGTVMVWDSGTWIPESSDVEAALGKGDLKFTLHGKKLKGSWVLARTRGYGHNADRSPLLIKHPDRFASSKDIATLRPRSALTDRLLVDIARENDGDMEKAATGDPQPTTKQAAHRKPKPTTPTRAATKRA